jgi:hypothetical protein
LAGKICKYAVATAANCVEPTDAAEACTLVPGTVDSDLYCDLRTDVGKCEKKSDNTCVARGATCAAYSYTTTGAGATAATKSSEC